MQSYLPNENAPFRNFLEPNSVAMAKSSNAFSKKPALPSNSPINKPLPKPPACSNSFYAVAKTNCSRNFNKFPTSFKLAQLLLRPTFSASCLANPSLSAL